MISWILDVAVPALNRAKEFLDRWVPWLPMALAAVVLMTNRDHFWLRAVCLAACVCLHGRIVKRCRRVEGGYPWPVYLSAFFPLLMVSVSFLGAPLVWQICMLVWAKHRR